MKNQNRFTPEEDEVLREHYPSKGATWVALSGLIRDMWTPLAVRYRAAKLHLTVEKKITRQDAMRDIEALRVRCEVDDESGCWVYRGAYGKAKQPAVYLPQYPTPRGAPGIYLPPRAAWLLSGKRLPNGHLVFQKSAYCATGCCNPEHLMTGNKAAMLARVMKKPEVSKSPARRAQYESMRLRRAHPPEKVAEVQSLLAEGLHFREVAERSGISDTVVRKIRDGQHIHCTRAQSSIFTMARAA